MDDCWQHILLLCDYQTCNQISYVNKQLNHIVNGCWYFKYVHDQLPYKSKSLTANLDSKWYYLNIYENNPKDILDNWIYQYDKLPYHEDWKYKYIHMITVLNLRKDHLDKLEKLLRTTRSLTIKESLYPILTRKIIKGHISYNLFNTSLTIYKLKTIDVFYRITCSGIVLSDDILSFDFIKQFLLDLIYHES